MTGGISTGTYAVGPLVGGLDRHLHPVPSDVELLPQYAVIWETSRSYHSLQKIATSEY